MFRVPLLCLAIFAAAWLEFTVFPGHTYLEGDTQLYLPMLERMDAPGLLSRDLVATNPTLSLTAYDEVTLLLHEAAHLPFRKALLGQEFLFRIAALVGLFLLARATGLGHLFAFVLAVLLSLGTTLAGPAIALTDKEPLPASFAFSLTLLAMGLLSQDKPLLAALAAGVAFLYDPVVAAPFWVVLLLAFWLNHGMRQLVRPMLPVLLVFLLLLANLAQLQPGTAAEPLLTRISPSLAQFQRTFATNLYISSWTATQLTQLAALCAFGYGAALRCRPLLGPCLRWLLLGTALCGLLSMPISYILTDQSHLLWAARLQPTRTLLFTAAACGLFFGLAGMRAILQQAPWEACGWFLLLALLPLSHDLFDMQQTTKSHLSQFAIAAALSALLTSLLLRFAASRVRFVAIAAPACAILAFAYVPGLRPTVAQQHLSTADLAAWADASTWGSSLFLFPDAGRAAYPSVFRAQSRHALWVDWETAQGLLYSDSASALWQDRWHQSMQTGFSIANLESMLPLPIDYYVLRKSHQLLGPRSAFTNQDFVVYDAEDLRNFHKPLILSNPANVH